MKRNFLATTLAAFFLFTCGAAMAAEAVKPQVGVVKMATLYQESKAGKAAMAWLEGIQKEAVTKLESMQASLAKAQEAKDEALVQRLQTEMQGAAYAMQGILSNEQERLVGLITTTLNKVMEQYRASKGLAVIVNSDSVQVFAPEADVTADILALFDKENVDFGAKPPLELAPGDATPAKPAAAAPAKPADAKPSDTKPAAPAK